MEYPIHRFRALADLTAREEGVLRGLGDGPVTRQRGDSFQREGEKPRGFHLLLAGWITSSILLRSGDRLIQKVHLPGDMLGTTSMVLPTAADTLTAITEAVTAFVPYDRFAAIFTTAPRLAALFMIAVQMERLSLIDTLAVTGNACARERMARLLIDLYARLQPIGGVEANGFLLPLTQGSIGELLGLTPIHVNRTIRAMERDRLIAREGQRIVLCDLDALRQLCPLPPRRSLFNPNWLPPAG